MTVDVTPSPVRLKAVAAPGQPDPSPELEQLYRGFEQELLVPLWTEIGDLMPMHPKSKAAAHLWRWERLKELAAQAGRIVPVGRGRERSRWPTRHSAANPTRPRPCGPLSST